MCVPCKVVLDGENQRAAGMADDLAAIAAGEVDNVEPGSEEDDALYDLACIEVEHILAMRGQALAMAKRIGAPDRWMKLMHQLYGAA